MYVGCSRSIVGIECAPRWDLSTLIRKKQFYMIYEIEFTRPWSGQCEWWKKFPSDFTNELKLNKSYIWQTMEFDEFFMTSILSELTIEELNHMITTSRGLSFCFVGLSLHAARHHWWIVGTMRIILMVNNSRLESYNCSNPLKEVLIIFWWKSKYFSLTDRIESMGSHIKRSWLIRPLNHDFES